MTYWKQAQVVFRFEKKIWWFFFYFQTRNIPRTQYTIILGRKMCLIMCTQARTYTQTHTTHTHTHTPHTHTTHTHTHTHIHTHTHNCNENDTSTISECKQIHILDSYIRLTCFQNIYFLSGILNSSNLRINIKIAHVPMIWSYRVIISLSYGQ